MNFYLYAVGPIPWVWLEALCAGLQKPVEVCPGATWGSQAGHAIQLFPTRRVHGNQKEWVPLPTRLSVLFKDKPYSVYMYVLKHLLVAVTWTLSYYMDFSVNVIRYLLVWLLLYNVILKSFHFYNGSHLGQWMFIVTKSPKAARAVWVWTHNLSPEDGKISASNH